MSRIYEEFTAFEAENVPPQMNEAIVVPDMILRAHKLPEELRQPVELIWDASFRAAVEYAEAVALILAELGASDE